MKADFGIGELKSALESGYGVAVAALERLPGHAHSINFKVATEDGAAFAAKCFPAAHVSMFERLLAHTAPSENPLAVTRLFDGRILEFGSWRIAALKWIPGGRKYPDELTDAEADEFLSAYGAFAAGLKDDGFIMPVRDGLALKRKLIERLKGGNAPAIVRELKLMPDDTLSLAPEARRIIHGDLHWENFRFEGGRVSGFLDLEALRFGTPAEDFVRYIVCRAEHLRWYDLGGRRRLLDAFRMFLARTSLTRAEWLFAIDGYLLRKLDKKIKARRVPLATRINLGARFGFYRELRDEVYRAMPHVRTDDRTVVKILGGTVKRFMGGRVFDWGGRFRFVCDPACRDYDWLCVYDELPNAYPGVVRGRMRVECPRGRTILATQEPVSVKFYNKAYTRQFGVLLTNRPPEAEGHPGYVKGEGYMVWYTGRSFAGERAHEVPEKTKVLSAVYSAKRMAHTRHADRYRFLELLRREVSGFDWFGKGVKPIEEKSDALDGYKYTIAFENHIGAGHWTEKLSDALVAGCLPFYAGDPEVGRILPPDCFIPIPADDPDAALAIVKKAIAEGEYGRRRDAIMKARELLMTKYNLFAQIEKACEWKMENVKCKMENGEWGMDEPSCCICTRRHTRLYPSAAVADLTHHIKRLLKRSPGGTP